MLSIMKIMYSDRLKPDLDEAFDYSFGRVSFQKDFTDVYTHRDERVVPLMARYNL
ncbi:hypothetical protein MA16_Dca029168 [Dendrobium catenatum]|uniref:Uncharacterized protein n=1 Tax=Dendrobium catenatum TaxID=906689 RepID=A0A2I0VGE0_9ASPA|nr:hypothetical protein MA16_Dca029168 [Dendrobium catenatum]